MSARPRWIPLVCASLATALLTSGCFRGPRLGTVTGTVTLDGNPLASAQVEFQPNQGAPSYGTTNSLGQYELMYTKEKPGARVGSHVVRITTQTTAVDKETGEEYQIPQQVPEKYNFRSELIRQVKPEPNLFDFRLESEPEKEEPPEDEPEAKEPGEEKPQPEKPGEEKPKPEEPDTEAPQAAEPLAEAGEPRDSGKRAATPQWAEVSGTVISNGQPLVGATVRFQPDQGPASQGTTDQNGRYELTSTRDHKGAVVGKHTVRITGADAPAAAEAKEIDRGKLVPAIYNVESELSVEIRPGNNRFDFDLQG